MIKLALIGNHKHICPLARASHLSPSMDISPENSDLFIIANIQDLRNLSSEEILKINDRSKIALVSEEPYWDYLFSPSPTSIHLEVPISKIGSIFINQINHSTTNLFEFQRIPYFPTTSQIIQKAYRSKFRRNAQKSHQEWKETTFEFDYGFLGTYRPENYLSLKNENLVGLCQARTSHAQANIRNNIIISGKGWPHTTVNSEDWHVEKIKNLDMKCRKINAIENTYAPYYITEKMFDAFACGAIPIIWPRSDDALERIGIVDGSYLTPNQEETDIDWRAYEKTQINLAHLWNSNAIHKERYEFSKRLEKNLRKIL